MKITLKNLFQNNSTAEALPHDIFGKYLFGSARDDEPASRETDTEDENKFLKILKRFFGLSHEGIKNNKNDFVEFFKICLDLKNKSKYKNILTPKKGKVYRVLYGIPFKKTSELLKIDEQILYSERGQVITSENVNIYKPKNNISSWTYNSSIILNSLEENNFMVDPDSWQDTCLIIFEANIDSNDNFLFNHDYITKVSGYNIIQYNEQEVLALGNVKVDKAYCITPYVTESGYLDVNEMFEEIISFSETL
jgi:hypothetical protein